MQVSQVAIARGPGWIGSGWAWVRRGTGYWLTMSAIYLAVALLLQQIPFIGYLLLVVITPIVAACAVAATHRLDDGATDAEAGGAREEKGSAQTDFCLFQLLRDQERNLPVMVVATLTLGAMVVITILAQILKVGGAALPAMFSGSVGPSIWIPALVSLILVWGLKLGVIVTSLLAIYLITLRRESPLSAIEKGMRALARNPVALGLLALVLLVPLPFATLLPAPYGQVALFAIGLVTLPLFVTSSYAAFKELFPG